MSATVTLTIRTKERGSLRITGAVSNTDAGQLAVDFERRIREWRERKQKEHLVTEPTRT